MIRSLTSRNESTRRKNVRLALTFDARVAQFRTLVGRDRSDLIGAKPSEIAYVPSTSFGENLVVQSLGLHRRFDGNVVSDVQRLSARFEGCCGSCTCTWCIRLRGHHSFGEVGALLKAASNEHVGNADQEDEHHHGVIRRGRRRRETDDSNQVHGGGRRLAPIDAAEDARQEPRLRQMVELA